MGICRSGTDDNRLRKGFSDASAWALPCGRSFPPGEEGLGPVATRQGAGSYRMLGRVSVSEAGGSPSILTADRGAGEPPEGGSGDQALVCMETPELFVRCGLLGSSFGEFQGLGRWPGSLLPTRVPGDSDTAPLGRAGEAQGLAPAVGRQGRLPLRALCAPHADCGGPSGQAQMTPLSLSTGWCT